MAMHMSYLALKWMHKFWHPPHLEAYSSLYFNITRRLLWEGVNIFQIKKNLVRCICFTIIWCYHVLSFFYNIVRIPNTPKPKQVEKQQIKEASIVICHTSSAATCQIKISNFFSIWKPNRNAHCQRSFELSCQEFK